MSMMQVAEQTANGSAIAVAVATVAGWLPSVAALLSIVWLSVQIYLHWDKVVDKFKGKKGE